MTQCKNVISPSSQGRKYSLFTLADDKTTRVQRLKHMPLDFALTNILSAFGPQNLRPNSLG